MSGRTSKRYPVELRERAVRMVGEVRSDHESEWAARAVESICAQLTELGLLQRSGAGRCAPRSGPRVLTSPAIWVGRDFRPLEPDRLWVADFTYVSTWSGWCYTALVIDAAPR